MSSTEMESLAAVKNLARMPWQTLKEDLTIEGIVFSKGRQFKLYDTADFVVAVFQEDANAPSNLVSRKLMFKLSPAKELPWNSN